MLRDNKSTSDALHNNFEYCYRGLVVNQGEASMIISKKNKDTQNVSLLCKKIIHSSICKLNYFC